MTIDGTVNAIFIERRLKKKKSEMKEKKIFLQLFTKVIPKAN